MGGRLFSAALLLSLLAGDVSSAELVILGCGLTTLERRLEPAGLKATMRIQVAPGSSEAMRDAFRLYAASHALVLRSWGYDDQTRDWQPTILLEDRPHDVAIKIVAPNRLGVADIELIKTCRSREEWQPHWREIKAFVAASNYRILSSNDLVEGDHLVGGIDIRPLLSPPPLDPINTQQ